MTTRERALVLGPRPAEPARGRTAAAPAAEQRPGYSRAALTLILTAAFMVVLDKSLPGVNEKRRR